MLSWCAERQGQRLRSNALPDGFRLYRIAGMTCLETLSYRMPKQEGGSSYLVAYAEKGVEVPTPEQFRELNPPYYRGVEERNGYRRALLADPARIWQLAQAITAVQRAKATLNRAIARLKPLVEYPNPENILIKDTLGVTID